MMAERVIYHHMVADLDDCVLCTAIALEHIPPECVQPRNWWHFPAMFFPNAVFGGTRNLLAKTTTDALVW